MSTVCLVQLDRVNQPEINTILDPQYLEHYNISKYSLIIKEYSLDQFPSFIYISTPYLKLAISLSKFLEPENLL